MRWLVVLLAAALGGCVKSSVEELKMRPMPAVSSEEKVVVLGRHDRPDSETEGDFTDCVRAELDGTGGLEAMDEKTFVDRMFPWFEPRTAPRNAADLAKLLADPAVARRLDETRIRYVVWLDGATKDGDKGGQITCGVGPFGGCMGVVWWEKNAAYEAAIWDLADRQSMGKVTVAADGTSYVPAVIVPVPLIARTQATACADLGSQLAAFFSPDPAAKAAARARATPAPSRDDR